MEKGEEEEDREERGGRKRRVMVHNCRAQTLTNLEGVGFNNSLCVWCGVVCGVCGVCVGGVCVGGGGVEGGGGHNHSNVQ